MSFGGRFFLNDLTLEMAARLRLRHQEEIRSKIQASQLVNRLQNHANGDCDMTPTQVQAAKILLDKSVSNAPTELSGPDGDDIPLGIVERRVVKKVDA